MANRCRHRLLCIWRPIDHHALRPRADLHGSPLEARSVQQKKTFQVGIYTFIYLYVALWKVDSYTRGISGVGGSK